MTWMMRTLAALALTGLVACDDSASDHPIVLDDGREIGFVRYLDTENWADGSYFLQLLVRWPDWEDSSWETIREVMPQTCNKIVAHLRAAAPDLELRKTIVLKIEGGENYGIVTFSKSQAVQYTLEGDTCIAPDTEKEG